MRKNPGLFFGLFIFGLLIAGIITAYFWTPYDPEAFVASALEPPTIRHIFGTDDFGRDIFSRVMKGAGTTLAVGTFTIVIGAAVGLFVGAVTGFFGGAFDEIIMRINDAITAFPSILLALVIISLLGPEKTSNLVIALGIAFIPSYARVSRTAVLREKNQNYVTAARLMGAANFRIMSVHILPNTVSVLLPALTIGFNNAVLAEASMSYLGIGVSPVDPSLGFMLKASQSFLFSAPWYAITTGLTMVLMVLSVGLIGDGLKKIGR